MGEMEWTNDLVFRLIKEYRDRPQLWDATHSMYRVNTLKYEAWRELAAIFEVDMTDLRKKLNSVFASHRRELKRVREGRKSSWFLYPHLDFLPSHIDDSHLEDATNKRSEAHNSNASTNAGSSAEENDNETDQDDAVEFEREELIIKGEPKIDHRRPITRPIPRARVHQMAYKPRLKRPIIKKRIVKETTQSNQPEGTLSEVVRLLRRSNIRRTKDSCDSFGEYIADSLRKHDERTQAMIKQAINNIIFEQEMKMYRSNSNENEYTVVISEMDQNPLA